MLQSPDSPDLAACHFFLFGYLKSQLEGKTLFDENDVKEELDELGRHFELRRLKDLKRRVRQISRVQFPISVRIPDLMPEIERALPPPVAALGIFSLLTM
jgi:hypothetical protein